MDSRLRPQQRLVKRLALQGAGVCAALLMGLPAQAEENRPRRDPPRPTVPTPRTTAKAPIKPNAGTTEQARIEAACVRYRLVWGMDCPYENGSGEGGVDPMRDVRRLGVQTPTKK